MAGRGSNQAAHLPEAPIGSFVFLIIGTVAATLWFVWLYRGNGWKPFVVGYGVAAVFLAVITVLYGLERLR